MAFEKSSVVLITTLFLNLISISSSSDILLLMPLATKSETHLLNPIAKELLQRGHKVTLVTCAGSKIKHSNFTEIIPTKPLDLGDFDPTHSDILEGRRSKDDLRQVLFMDLSHIYDRCHQTYQHKDMGQVINATGYDLVVTSAFFSECFMGLIHKLKAPFIHICSMPMPKEVFDLSGLRLPLSFVPNPFMEFTDRMTLGERLANTLSSWSFKLLNTHHFYKIGEKAYKTYLGDDFPDVEDLKKNVSLTFSNTHFSLNFPRPLMPDIVEIGGVHTQEAKPLPKDIEEFVSGGKHGFIFFSMGTVFKEETLPPALKKIFINVFSRLKQRVLWKWATPLEGLPENVKVSSWLPQQDVLGHSKIKLFISHGGLLSTQEATYHGVKILGIPLFVDQDANVKQAVAHGYALKVEILELTEEILEDAIKKLLNEPSFSEKAQLSSQIFRDQPQTPLERAIYWIEYVIKYKGAPQLRSAAKDLTYFEYHLYDVQLILFGILATILIICWKIVSICISKCSSRRERRKLKSKKYQ